MRKAGVRIVPIGQPDNWRAISALARDLPSFCALWCLRPKLNFLARTAYLGLGRVVNHQTHHRGQAHCLLTGILGNDATPALDLLLFQRERGMAKVG